MNKIEKNDLVGQGLINFKVTLNYSTCRFDYYIDLSKISIKSINK